MIPSTRRLLYTRGKETLASHCHTRRLFSKNVGATTYAIQQPSRTCGAQDWERKKQFYSSLPSVCAMKYSHSPPPLWMMTMPRGYRGLATTREEENHPAGTTDERTLRQRATDLRDSARERASLLRDSARERYHEFQENPRASATKGAQSVGEMVRRYGPVFIGTYFSVYVSTLGLLFLGVESGALDPAVLFSLLGGGEGEEAKNTVHLVVEFLNNHSYLEPLSGFVEKNPSVANFAVAWIAVKFTEPLRLPVALALTPRVARFVGWTTPDTEDEAQSGADHEKKDNVSQTTASMK